ncbi:hypothetical protein MTO96_028850 [Rhipicephalus appendiculatus]
MRTLVKEQKKKIAEKAGTYFQDGEGECDVANIEVGVEEHAHGASSSEKSAAATDDKTDGAKERLGGRKAKNEEVGRSRKNRMQKKKKTSRDGTNRQTNRSKATRKRGSTRTVTRPRKGSGMAKRR